MKISVMFLLIFLLLSGSHHYAQDAFCLQQSQDLLAIPTPKNVEQISDLSQLLYHIAVIAAQRAQLDQQLKSNPTDTMIQESLNEITTTLVRWINHYNKLCPNKNDRILLEESQEYFVILFEDQQVLFAQIMSEFKNAAERLSLFFFNDVKKHLEKKIHAASAK